MHPDKANILTHILRKLLLEKSADGKRQFLSKSELLFLCGETIEALKPDGTLAELDPPVVICGDTHGQLYDVLRLFDHAGWPPDTRYLFLGDYVDRGAQGIELVALMFAFKIAYPNDFYILRGNHECANINRVYGLWDDCKKRYNEMVYWALNKTFAYIPLAGLISGRIFCMHGGLSPELKSFDQIRQMKRPIEAVDGGIPADLLWSDPQAGINGFVANVRGISYKFGEDALLGFCSSMGIDLVVRAHQVVMAGYEFFGTSGRLVTIFSAPKYCDQFDNSAAMMLVSEDLKCKIKQLTL